ncbi:translation machinery-associated protein 16 homolog [Schistocerca americana]|uniref:translation machinery-associated protein 16 homolog n=1 Tax=Schistocerca americana TaxID=7009 RepID=UPI001F4F6F85|nr:translation machinery-associated protein 16 homolog [Schistocerca americana]
MKCESRVFVSYVRDLSTVKMPKSIQNDLKKLTKVIHPRSRKAQQLTKKISRISAREKIKLIHQVRQNLLGEKLQWFKDNLDANAALCTAEMLMELIERYLHRFDDELEQIELKRTIGGHRSRQHASREDIIRMTILKDREDYETGGIELPDILATSQLALLRQWQGELRFLQKFRLRLFSKRFLSSIIGKSVAKEKANSENQSDSSESTSINILPEEDKDSTLPANDGNEIAPNKTEAAEEHMETDT